MRRSAKFLLVLAALPLASLAATLQYKEAESAITLEGPLVDGDDAKFEALLDRRPHNLIIRSDGGRQVPAMGIARALHARQMTVIVDGFCASACAQIIMPAAAERRIRPGGFVAFHNGNLAALQAVREALALATAQAAQAPDPAVLQKLKQAEAQIDGIDANQVAFEADMKLDPAVIDFYLRLTAPGDFRVELHTDEPKPVRVAVGRKGICDWWVPDRAGLAKLGMSLRNAYDVPTPEQVATMAGTTPSRLYFGPPVSPDDPRFATLCPPP